MATSITGRPDISELADYQIGYISKVPGDDIMKFLEQARRSEPFGQGLSGSGRGHAGAQSANAHAWLNQFVRGNWHFLRFIPRDERSQAADEIAFDRQRNGFPGVIFRNEPLNSRPAPVQIRRSEVRNLVVEADRHRR